MVINLRYINSASESLFDEIALMIVSFRQDGLVERAESHNDGNARLNGHIISKSSPFVKSLNEHVKRLNLLDSASTTPWTVLHVITTVGLMSPLVQKQLNSLLQQTLTRIIDVRPEIMGLLLSLSGKDAKGVAFDQILSTLDSHAERLLADVTLLNGLETYVSTSPDSIAETLKSLSRHLERNLSYPSHIIRNSTLLILKQLTHGSPVVEAMLEIDNTPRTVENIRSTSLAMRKLASLSTAETDPFLIAFCFGLLTINFSPLWGDACAVLKAVANRSGPKLWDKAFADLNVEENDEVDINVSKGGKQSAEDLANAIWEDHQLEMATRRESLRDKVPLPTISC